MHNNENTTATIAELDALLSTAIPAEVKKHLYDYRDLLKGKATR